MEPFRTKDTHGKALSALVSASLELEATSPGAVLLNRYFGKADWLHFDSGDRKISAQVEIGEGRLQAGGHVVLAEAPLRMEVAGFIADGQASARLETAPAAGTDVPDLQVTTIGYFGLRGGKIDIRFRALIDSRGAFGKARARHHDLKVGIGLTAHKRDLKIVRVGTWYEKDDIPGMPPFLPELEEIGAR